MNLPKHFNGQRGKAIPTGIPSPSYPLGTHYRLEPSWWPNEGDFVVVSDIGEGPMIFLSNEKAEGANGLLTPCVEGPLSDWGYDIVHTDAHTPHPNASK